MDAASNHGFNSRKTYIFTLLSKSTRQLILKTTGTFTHPYCNARHITTTIVTSLSQDRDSETFAIDYSIKHFKTFRDLWKAGGINTPSQLKSSTMCSQLIKLLPGGRQRRVIKEVSEFGVITIWASQYNFLVSTEHRQAAVQITLTLG